MSCVSKQKLAAPVLAAGVLMFLVALSADSLGLGANPGIGVKQIALAIVGVLAAAAGMVMLRGGGR